VAGDYKVIDMPSMMARTVTKRSTENEDLWVRDDDWYDQIRAMYKALLSFFVNNSLLIREVSQSSIDDVVVMFSDLNGEGQALVHSGADDKWLSSFDRPGAVKPPSDTASLKKALNKIRAGERPHIIRQ
jgi:hypothetical protein